MNIRAHKIMQHNILRVEDSNFRKENVCIVTGCGFGVGRAVAIAAAVNGLTVVGVDFNAVEAEGTALIAQSLGGFMRVVWADLTKNADIEKVVKAAAALGTIKYLANIARIEYINSARKTLLDQYDAMQRRMLRAPYYLSVLVVEQMKRSPGECSVIANMASIHDHDTTLNMPTLNIIDYGLRGLSRSLSAEGGGKVRSFTVGTGFAKAAPARSPMDDLSAGKTPEIVAIEMMTGKHRGTMTPLEIANLFIAGFSRKGAHLREDELLRNSCATLPITDTGIGERQTSGPSFRLYKEA